MLHDIDNHLTDYQLMTYFNPHYHESLISELMEDKEDLYHQSGGMTDFDNVFGITRVSVPVETLAIKSCSIDGRIALIESKFEQHTANLDDFKASLDANERSIIDEYFYQQFYNHRTIQHPLLRFMKEALYFVVTDQRENRNIQRKKAKYESKVARIRAFKERQGERILTKRWAKT